MTRKILVAVDMEDESLMARMLRTAGDLAGLYGGEIWLVHVAANLPSDVRAHLPEDFEARMTDEVGGKLDDMVRVLDLPSDRVHVNIRIGSIYRKVLEEADAVGAELIVIGGHAPDVADYLLGSNAARVVRRASCSVYVVR